MSLQDDERIAKKLLNLSSRSSRVEIRNGMTYLDGYALGNGTVEIRSQVVRERRRREVSVTEIASYAIAILYYVDSPTEKTVWLRDDTDEPVQIATWPKRLATGFPSVSTNGSTIGYLSSLLGNDAGLDDLRANLGAGSNPNRLTIEAIVSGSGGGFVFSNNQSVGYTASGYYAVPWDSDYRLIGGSVSIPSISNQFKVFGFTKTSAGTHFALVTEPIISPTNRNTSPDVFNKIQHGTALSNVTDTWPTAPAFSPNLYPQTGVNVAPYRGQSALTLWRTNYPLWDQGQDVSVVVSSTILDNTPEGITVQVQDTRNSVSTFSSITVPPLPPHERIIGCVAFPVNL